MDVISFYSIRREKTSLTSSRILKLNYILILGIWFIFCITELPQLQEQQRIINTPEQPILLQPEPYIPKSIPTSPKKEIVVATIEPNIEEFTEEVETEEFDPPKYTDENLILLARLIEAEGGIESYQCKLYIGSVVLNRMTSDEFPDSLQDVIFQVNNNGTHQFSVTMVREDGTRAIDCTPSEESLEAAAELLTYGTQLPGDVMVFYTENCKGNWVNTRETYTQVDHTIFAYIYAD